MTLNQKISQAIQEWLLDLSTPDAKVLAQDLNKLGAGKKSFLAEQIRENPDVHVAAHLIHNYIDTFASSISMELEVMGTEDQP